MRPNSVKVGPYRFSIKFSKKDIKRHVKKDINNYYGITAIKHEEIVVLPTDNTIEKDSLLHEILHVAFMASGLNAIISSSKEEQIISALSPTLLSVLKDNPDVLAFLLETNEL